MPAVPVVAPIFTSRITGTSFYFNGSAAKQADAQAACLAAGGHLATYASMEEQAEVEEHYVTTGHLLPACQRAYWLGYKYAGVWPDFRCGPTVASMGWHVCRRTQLCAVEAGCYNLLPGAQPAATDHYLRVRLLACC